MSTDQALMLLLLATGALLVPLVSERLGLFAAPCEILYGTLVATVLPWASAPQGFTATLAQFGFLLLLFLAGMEIDFSLLRRGGPARLARAAGAAVGIQLLCVGIGALQGWPPVTVLMLGAMSLSVVLVVLREDGLSRAHFGQSVMLVAAFGEFLSMAELTGYDLIGRYGVDWSLATAAAKLLALLLVGYAALRGVNGAIARRPAMFARLVASRDPSEVGVRAALALLLAFVAMAQVLRIEPLLAAFIAGAVCGFAFRGRNALNEKLSTMAQGFFVPIFFITVGLGLRLQDLVRGAALGEVIGLLLGLFLARMLGVPLLVMAGFAWREAVPAMLLLSSPLTLQVAFAQVAVALGALDTQARTAVLGMTITAALVFPLLARPLVPRPHVQGVGAHVAPVRVAPLEALPTRPLG